MYVTKVQRSLYFQLLVAVLMQRCNYYVCNLQYALIQTCCLATFNMDKCVYNIELSDHAAVPALGVSLGITVVMGVALLVLLLYIYHKYRALKEQLQRGEKLTCAHAPEGTSTTLKRTCQVYTFTYMYMYSQIQLAANDNVTCTECTCTQYIAEWHMYVCSCLYFYQKRRQKWRSLTLSLLDNQNILTSYCCTGDGGRERGERQTD